MRRTSAYLLLLIMSFNLFGDFTGTVMHELSHLFNISVDHHTLTVEANIAEMLPHGHHEHGDETHHHGGLVSLLLSISDDGPSHMQKNHPGYLSLLMMTLDGFVTLGPDVLNNHVFLLHNHTPGLNTLISQGDLDIPTPPPRFFFPG